MKLRLNFKVNPYYLLASYFDYYENIFWWDPEKYDDFLKVKRFPKFLYQSFWLRENKRIFLKVNNKRSLKQLFNLLYKNSRELFNKILESKEFKKFLKETEDYSQWLENEWNLKKDIVLKNLEDITGLKIIDKNLNVDVFVVKPPLKGGFVIPHKKIIVWGHSEDWSNYSIVYLCHELLHILTYKKYKHPNLMHALIELATDNELRIRLNGGKYPPFVGHSYLENIKKKIYPIWKQYLNKKLKVKDIIELEELILRKKII
ncbi:MAG: hypothetical protein KatS3mg096_249 [Candidatus Parcubacteria bacterium]|nr:MAG: hypothetical protein KatS3mg096_249 [Candidatus Parcubacteria bacterium]